MAKKPQEIAADHSHRVSTYTLGKDEEGESMIEVQDYAMKMIQVVGEFGTAHVEVLGEILPGEMDQLTDYDGIPLTFYGRGIKSTDDRCSKIMPRVVGGNDLTKLRVGIMLCRVG